MHSVYVWYDFDTNDSVTRESAPVLFPVNSWDIAHWSIFSSRMLAMFPGKTSEKLVWLNIYFLFQIMMQTTCWDEA